MQKAQPSPKKKLYLFYLIFCAVLAIVFFVGAEVMLRIAGERPWVRRRSNAIIEPGGKLHQEHPTLGYINLPGRFKITLPTSYIYTITYHDNTLRITHPLDTYSPEKAKDEIWIFGGSLTHGYSLNDDETYPWILQEQFPQYEVVNFGVDGYSTLQSFIQFREALKERKNPTFVVLAYAHFHDERNTFGRRRRKQIASANEIGRIAKPYAWINEDGELAYAMAKVEYREIPFMRYSALVNFLENKYNIFEIWFHRSHSVSRLIVKEFADLAEEIGIDFVVAGINSSSRTRRMLRYAKSQGIMIADISVDLKVKENTNLPHDRHPSAVANKQFAQKLEVFLRNR